ncbi:predicted protein [Histoplasma capsulatum G186AR]|uniref:Uncharacterized protein n=1 Tax=Ajellomyces capsulatus (strain G186AR / H82 / ATCC MYA-2454 / RMSCC 2432) TaxID=447093 RepID=C0NW95_AJECG|nr:uncharacterized protein HCBG_07425 [Histoplasma capsulatum G186AR]EEH04200.1 predicted protein [Histoplasma capsulatum G186AR]
MTPLVLPLDAFQTAYAPSGSPRSDSSVVDAFGRQRGTRLSSRFNVARPNVDEKRAQIGPGCYRVFWAWRVSEPSLTRRCLGSEERNSRITRPATRHLANASSRRSSERQRDKEEKPTESELATLE